MGSLAKSAWILVICILLAQLLAGSASAQALRIGMQGEQVRALQERLVRLGYDLEVDGVFGSQTRAAVIQVQELAGIAADGIVGPETQAALQRLEESVTTYVVQPGDTLSAIAYAYGTTVNQLMRRNGLSNPHQVAAGQRLLVPNLSQLTVAGSRRSTGLEFSWPVRGQITSGYGWRTHPVLKVRHFHAGVDISAPRGTPVKAAAAGKVVRAGPLGAFGLAVVIDHGNGYSTWYGHLSKLLVRTGEMVAAGQQIGLVGSTGRTTGPHLDFRIKIGEYAVNPLEFLP